jgi:uncharacterized protein
MQLVNCKVCGKLFQKTLWDLCDACIQAERHEIESISDFVSSRDDEFVSIETISNELVIEISRIEELYRKGKLIKVAHKISSKCKICGEETKSINKNDNFCPKCHGQIAEDLETRNPQLNIEKVKAQLKKFDKDVMHSVKPPSADQGQRRYGFKKNYD